MTAFPSFAIILTSNESELKMEKNEDQLNLEIKQFNKTTDLAKAQLLDAQKQNEANMAAIKEAQQEVRENAAHNIGNLWNSDSYEALIELSQTINPVNQKLADYEAVEKNIERLKKSSTILILPESIFASVTRITRILFISVNLH